MCAQMKENCERNLRSKTMNRYVRHSQRNSNKEEDLLKSLSCVFKEDE